MPRYIVHNESISGHDCCFEATVIDSTTGFEVCECPDKLDALTIASLLNGMERQKEQEDKHLSDISL